MNKEISTGELTNYAFLLGGGEMGARLREMDWSKTGLGSPESWPQSLKTAVRIMLTCRQPMFVWWGEELINLYNDAYKSVLGGKHPEALGKPAALVWREIWDQVGPRAASATHNDEGTFDESLLLIMERNGFPEETYYTFSYSPVPNDRGGIGGMICACFENTAHVVGERQLALLRELAAQTVEARTLAEACTRSAKCLETNPQDFPFALIYIIESPPPAPFQQLGKHSTQKKVVLAGTAGIPRDHPAVPQTVNLEDNSIWPFAEALQTNNPCLVTALESKVSQLPTGVWNLAPHQAVAIPIAQAGQKGKAGILIVGLNPYRLFDDNYRGFLELVAAQIAASLANAQAYEEERKRSESLAELDRAKTVFFSNVSHEFRTPLTLMLGPLEDVLAQEDGTVLPRDRERLAVVHRNGKRLLKLVNTLLDFSRIEAGRVKAVFEPVELGSFTTDLVSVFRSTVEKGGLRLIIDCPPLPEPIYVDREMWEKIVFNLVSNAFKYTLKGEIEVLIRAVGSCPETGLQQEAQQDRSKNGSAVLTVRDTGTGIPESELPNLFNRFHRIEGAAGRTHEGTGIGLALVQELVRLHGGEIGVQSIFGQGSTFTVTLPLGKAHLPADQLSRTKNQDAIAVGSNPFLDETLSWFSERDNHTNEQHRKSAAEARVNGIPSSSTEPPFLKPCILLAEDNADMRDYVRRLLVPHYEVIAVADGKQALRAAQERWPDLVVADVMMPNLDGFGFLKSLRSNPRTASIPVLMLSARAGEEARLEGFHAGVDDYLIKPFSARELLARVKSILTLVRIRGDANRALQESEQRFAQFMQHLPGLAWIKDKEGRYVFVNDAAEKAFQKTRGELYGKKDEEIFPPEMAAQFRENDRKAQASEKGLETIERLEQKDGLHYSLVNKFPIPGLDGTPALIGGMAIDITERLHTEAELRQSEERFRTLTNHAPVGIFLTKVNGDCLFVNQSWCNMTGLTPNQAQGAGWTKALHPEDRDRIASEWYTAVQNRIPFSSEYRFQKPDGSVTWVQGSAVELRDAEGTIVGHIGTVVDITQTRRTVEALRESEERFRNMADHAPVMVWITESDGSCSFLSKSWYDFTGQTPTTGLGFGWLDAVHPDYHKLTKVAFLNANLRQEPFRVEFRVRRKDGAYCWAIDVATPRFGSSGEFLGFIGSVIDITERKQAEEILRATQEQLQLVTDTMAVAVVRCSSDRRYVWVSRGYSLLLEKPADEIEGRYIPDVLGEEVYGIIRPYIDRVLAGEKVEYETLVNYQESSRPRWIRAVYVPTYGDTNTPNGWVGVIIDISDHKRQEEALRNSERLYRAIGESIDYGVWLCDPQGRNTYATESFLRLVGMTQEECSEFGWGRALHPDDVERTISAWKECVRSGSQWYMEHRFWGVDGKWHPILARGVPVKNERGEITAWAGINLDISQLKKVEEDLREADQRKDEFLATLAHELRNPLAPIRNSLHILRLAGNGPEAEPLHEMMERQVNHMVRLVDDLLEVSRITRGKIELRREPVELVPILQAALETSRPLMESGKHQLTVSLPSQSLLLEADAVRLAQVFANLLNNAAKYTEEDGQIWLTAQQKGNEVLVSIRDNGIGIPADMLPKVFDLFTQVDRTLGKAQGGLGIGLTLVRRLVEMHGGRVEARSAGPGQGSEFLVCLPLVKPAASKHDLHSGQDAVEEERKLGQGAPVRPPKRVLVVDDHQDAAESLGILLRFLGVEVQVAHNGHSALEALPIFQPAIVLLDIGMPGMDGYEVARRIRQMPGGKEVLLIALTGWGQPEDRRRSKEAGFDHHFVKPVDLDALEALLFKE